jgi:hypothetical protein
VVEKLGGKQCRFFSHDNQTTQTKSQILDFEIELHLAFRFDLEEGAELAAKKVSLLEFAFVFYHNNMSTNSRFRACLPWPRHTVEYRNPLRAVYVVKVRAALTERAQAEHFFLAI